MTITAGTTAPSNVSSQSALRDERGLPFRNLAEWLHSIGDILPERIVAHPLPGTATDADLLRLCEVDKRLVELVDATLVEKVMGTKESFVASRLIFRLLTFIEPRKLGEVAGEAGMFRMANGRVRLPDAAFVSAESLAAADVNPIAKVPFLLAVEVLSKTNTAREMQIKLKEYFDSGTRLMWIVDPKTQTVAVFDAVSETPSKLLTITDTLDGGNVLPGFQLPLNQLFTTPI